jgi:hypothetical protein
MSKGEELVQNFLDSLLEGSENKMASLFSKDAILLPTLSSNIYEGRGNIAKYFVDTFLPQNPVGEIVSSNTRNLGTGRLAVAGDWNFSINDDSDTIVKARYSMVFKRNPLRMRWEIVQMHSSLHP